MRGRRDGGSDRVPGRHDREGSMQGLDLDLDCTDLS